MNNSILTKGGGCIYISNSNMTSEPLLGNEILIEEFIPGREIQVAIMGNIKLGAIELKPKRKFYDYKAKYSSKAKTKHIMPAPLLKKI